MLAQKLLSGGAGEEKLYVDDVFQAFTRTGTGADVTVTTGVDMTKGYMLWSKGRSGATDHAIYDSARGATLDLASNSTAAQTAQTTGLKSVSATGHTVGSLAKMNTGTATYVDFVFRKAPKFFDVVTYTGNGAAGRQIPHALGVAPGMLVVKATSTTSNWFVYHVGAADMGLLNSTGAFNLSSRLTEVGSSTFTVTVNDGGSGATNLNGFTYVAYLFAHDTSADGLIQCGSFTATGADLDVNLGWEAQYVNFKASSAAGSWTLIDTSRGFALDPSNTTSPTARLFAENSSQELFANVATPTATGFKIRGGALVSGVTYIYMAIRRPNKPPTTGTQVYNAIAYTGDNTTSRNLIGLGFVPDWSHIYQRSGGNFHVVNDRLRGAITVSLDTSSTDAEGAIANTFTAWLQDGVTIAKAASGTGAGSTNNNALTYISHFLKRAPGVFDQVCYTGTGVTRTVNHSLGVAPELIIVKNRSSATNWSVGFDFTPTTFRYAELNDTSSYSGDGNYDLASSSFFTSPAPSATGFSVATNSGVNYIGHNFVAYLFATKSGISKIGLYTGNGTSQTINCGFSTGARFVMVKRLALYSDWYVWDTARGVVAENDPHLSLNSTATEVTTDDSIDPDGSGFIVNQVSATNINVSAASYIFLAIA